MSDRHVFGENRTPEIVPHKPTADFHARRQLLIDDFAKAARELEVKHTAEREALEAEFNALHQENARLAGFRR